MIYILGVFAIAAASIAIYKHRQYIKIKAEAEAIGVWHKIKAKL